MKMNWSQLLSLKRFGDTQKRLRNEQDEAKKKKNLDSVEIENLREGLRIKLEQLKKEYGNITHKTVFDTLVCQRK